jgi:hypothetical protein
VYHTFDIRSEIILKAWHYKPVSLLDPTGAVAEARLIVSGILAPVSLTVDQRRLDMKHRSVASFRGMVPRYVVRGDSLKSCEVSCDIPLNLGLDIRRPNYTCWRDGSCKRRGCLCLFEMEQAPFFCLQVCTVHRITNTEKRRPHRAPEKEPDVLFLVLKKSESVEGAYERVGGCKKRMNPRDPPFEKAEIATIKLV